jgi:hypothetical protein
LEQANLYYQKHLSKQAAPRSLTDKTLLHKITVLYLVVQMRHVPQDKPQYGWSRLEQFHTTFYDNRATESWINCDFLAFWGQIKKTWKKKV